MSRFIKNFEQRWVGIISLIFLMVCSTLNVSAKANGSVSAQRLEHLRTGEQTGRTLLSPLSTNGQTLRSRCSSWSNHHEPYIGSNPSTRARKYFASLPPFDIAMPKIAFTSSRDGLFEVFVMNSDGSGQLRLTNTQEGSFGPTWSPDGSKIVFTTLQGGKAQIAVMNADGSNVSLLTSGAYNNLHPAWSTYGSKIVFSSDRDGNDEIYVMNVDGSEQARLTNNSAGDFSPSWTSDGRIVFESDRDSHDEIYRMNPDGSLQTKITSDTTFDFEPAASPDGQQILFTGMRSEARQHPDIFLMNSDGTGAQRLTNDELGAFAPSWSTDGTKILFVSARDGFDQIYSMNSDGTGQMKLSDGVSADFDPQWQPTAQVPLTHTITGHVTASGSGMAAVNIALTGAQFRTSTTDQSGNYSLPDLPAGSYTITPSLIGYAFTPSTQAISNLQSDQTADFAGTVAYTISGTVSIGGVGLEGTIVSATGSQNLTASTDSSGHYFLSGFAPGSNISVSVSKLGFVFSPATTNVTALSADQAFNFSGSTAPAPATSNPGAVIISEFRLRGSQGSRDEFIELYNTTSSPLVVNTTDGSSGWAIVASGETSPATIAIIPIGTVIPAAGHYLIANGAVAGGYSLGTYGLPNLFYSSDIADSSGLALFRTSNSDNYILANRLDAAGFAGTPWAQAGLFREGAGIGAFPTQDGEYSFVRKIGSVLPLDTGDNAADFTFVSTNGGAYGSAQSVLGAPGPENLSSPVLNGMLNSGLIAPSIAATLAPNRVRKTTSYLYTDPTTGQTINFTLGTFSIRRTFTNNTGSDVTRLRFRIIDMTAGPAPSGVADLRAITSDPQVITVDSNTFTLQGTVLEEPPDQSTEGGGINSTLSCCRTTGGTVVGERTVSLVQPLAPGQTIALQFLMGVKQGGSFRFVVNVEAVP